MRSGSVRLDRIAWVVVALVATDLANGLGAGRATAAEPLALAATVALEGLARRGAWTEVELRVVAATGGAVSLEAGHAGPGPVTRAAAELEAGRPGRFRLPVWLPRDATGDALRVAARGPGGIRAERSLRLDWVQPGTWIVAMARDLGRPPAAAEAGVGRSIRYIEASAASLPVHPRALELVDALVLDPPTLHGLADAQLAAFEERLERCGKTIVVDAPAAAIRRGRERAGCGGAVFEAVPDRGALLAALTRLLATNGSSLPGTRELEEAFPVERLRTAESTLLAFFGLYAAVLVLGGMAWPQSWRLVSLSLLGSVLLALVLGSLPVDESRSFWVEQSAWGAGEPSRTARFASLIRVVAAAPGDVRVVVDRESGLPSPLPGTRPSAFEVDASEPGRAVTVVLPGALLGASALSTEGTVDWTSPLALAGGTDAPRVDNLGSLPAAPATLLWNGEAYRVPALAPGATFGPVSSRSRPLSGAELPRWLAAQRRSATSPRLVVGGVPEALGQRRAGPRVEADLPGWTTIRWVAGGPPRGLPEDPVQ